MDSLHKNWSLVRYRNLRCLLHLDTLGYALEKKQFTVHIGLYCCREMCCTLSRRSISIMLLLILPVLQHRYTLPELIRKVNTTNNKTLIFTPSTQGKICTITLHGISNIFVHFASRGARLGACVLCMGVVQESASALQTIQL